MIYARGRHEKAASRAQLSGRSAVLSSPFLTVSIGCRPTPHAQPFHRAPPRQPSEVPGRCRDNPPPSHHGSLLPLLLLASETEWTTERMALSSRCLITPVMLLSLGIWVFVLLLHVSCLPFLKDFSRLFSVACFEPAVLPNQVATQEPIAVEEPLSLLASVY